MKSTIIISVRVNACTNAKSNSFVFTLFFFKMMLIRSRKDSFLTNKIDNNVIYSWVHS